MSEINNRGVAHPPVDGTPTEAQAATTVHRINKEQYAKEFEPRGYARVSIVPEQDEPLAGNESAAEEAAEGE